MRVGFVGYTTTAIPGAENLLPQISAPKNYKDPLKIQEYIEEATRKARAELMDDPITGMLHKVSVLRRNNKDEPEVAKLPWPEVPVLELLNTYQLLVILQPSRFMRFAIADALNKQTKLTNDTMWAYRALGPSESSLNSPVIVDPMRMFVAGAYVGDDVERVMVRHRESFDKDIHKAILQQAGAMEARAGDPSLLLAYKALALGSMMGF